MSQPPRCPGRNMNAMPSPNSRALTSPVTAAVTAGPGGGWRHAARSGNDRTREPPAPGPSTGRTPAPCAAPSRVRALRAGRETPRPATSRCATWRAPRRAARGVENRRPPRERHQPVVLDRPTAEIARQIHDQPPSVGVGRLDAHVPRGARGLPQQRPHPRSPRSGGSSSRRCASNCSSEASILARNTVRTEGPKGGIRPTRRQRPSASTPPAVTRQCRWTCSGKAPPQVCRPMSTPGRAPRWRSCSKSWKSVSRTA